MASKVAEGAVPGLVYLVARGDAVQAEAIGTFEFGGGAPMSRDTVFRIASITKPIVTAAAMVLVEEGVLALDAPVDRWLPELADRRVLRRIDGPLDDTVPAERPITVEDLLTYRMGYGMIVEPSFDPPYPVIEAANALGLMTGPPEPRSPHDPDEWIRRFATLPLMDQPGQKWRYNVSALVLGVLLARAARQPLADVVRTRILEPLGMARTGFHLPVAPDEGLPGTYLTDFATGRMERGTASPIELWLGVRDVGGGQPRRHLPGSGEVRLGGRLRHLLVQPPGAGPDRDPAHAGLRRAVQRHAHRVRPGRRRGGSVRLKKLSGRLPVRS